MPGTVLRNLRRRVFRTACRWPLALVGGLLAGAALAQADPHAVGTRDRAAGLQDTVRALVAAAKLGEHVGVSIIDLASGREVASHHANLPLNPASNMKLVTAAASLIGLGADFRARTGLYGRLQGDSVDGGLYLKGYGDPTLDNADLLALARDLYAVGVRKVDEVIVDGSYFDDQILPPAFDQQPDEVSPFRAAVAAVSVNDNAYTLRVRPGAAAGDPARVDLDGPGHFVLTNKIATTPGGPPNVIAVQSSKGDKLLLRLSGAVPLGASTLAYRRRVESPLHYAGYVLVDALHALRIQAPERVALRKTPVGASLLASHTSPPLAQVLFALGKQSDNFVAEMLLKVLAAERVKPPGTSAEGARQAIETLKRLGVPTANVRMVNGSGLFRGNAIAAGHLSRLLEAVHRDAALRPEFLAHLAVGGVDGTLADRLQTLPTPRIVRAKTGTLADVVALSGYVLGPTPGSGMAFSVLANDVGGKVHAARQLADAIVTAIAADLYAHVRPTDARAQ